MSIDRFIKIAVDGPAGAGKGTICKNLANLFNLKYLDTGRLYRAVAALALQKKINANDHEALLKIAACINLENLINLPLRTEETAQMASKIATIPKIRAVLTEKMRDFANKSSLNYGGVILDGRDIATVVLPEADIKLFVTATPEVRQHRRNLENPNDNSSIMERDQRDEQRKESPLKPSADAIIIDTTTLDITTALATATEIVRKKIGVNPI